MVFDFVEAFDLRTEDLSAALASESRETTLAFSPKFEALTLSVLLFAFETGFWFA
jgi:hypothetical protein